MLCVNAETRATPDPPSSPAVLLVHHPTKPGEICSSRQSQTVLLPPGLSHLTAYMRHPNEFIMLSKKTVRIVHPWLSKALAWELKPVVIIHVAVQGATVTESVVTQKTWT